MTWRVRIKKAGVAVLALLGIAGLASMFWLGWVTNYMMGPELDSHLRIIYDVNEQLGFDYDTPEQGWQEPFVITAVEPEGPMGLAGLRVGDHVRLSSVSALYERIVFNQGKGIIVPIRRGNEKIAIKVIVPKLSLRDDPAKLHWYPW